MIGARARKRLSPLWRDGHLRWTAIAVAVGLVLRVVWVVAVARDPLGLADPARYLASAGTIADGDGYLETFSGQPTAYYPPGYPYFLGIVTLLARGLGLGEQVPLVAGLVQAVLGTATVAGVALLGRRLVGPAAGVAAAFVLALFPNLIFHSATLLGETLFNALFVGALVVVLWRPWSQGLPHGRVAGFAFLLALAVLVRPISLAVIPAVALAWWFAGRDLATTARRVGLTVVVLVLTVAPWTVRNAIRMDAFVPISTNTGDNLCIGHEPDADGGFALTEACNTGEGTANGTAAEVRHNRDATTLAFEYLGDNLDREPWLLWRRAVITFQHDHDAVFAIQSYGEDPFLDQRTEALLSDLADGVYYVVMAIGLIGMVAFASRRQPERLLIVLTAAATIAVPLVFFGDSRFKVPALPLLAVSAGAVLAQVGVLGERVAPRAGRGRR